MNFNLVPLVKCLQLQSVTNFNLTKYLVGNSTKGSLVGEVGNHQSGVDNGGNVVFGGELQHGLVENISHQI